jgi:hypothetical protein
MFQRVHRCSKAFLPEAIFPAAAAPWSPSFRGMLTPKVMARVAV